MSRKSTKSREPEDIRQTAVRLREADHQWLVAEAKKHATTLNSEIVWRLLRSRELSLGVELSTIIDAVIPRLTPYLAAANKCDAWNEGMLAGREMADVLAPVLAAGVLKGETGKKAAAAVNRLALARYALESMQDENKILSPGHASWQDAAAKQFKGIKEPEIEEHGAPEPNDGRAQS